MKDTFELVMTAAKSLLELRLKIEKLEDKNRRLVSTLERVLAMARHDDDTEWIQSIILVTLQAEKEEAGR